MLDPTFFGAREYSTCTDGFLLVHKLWDLAFLCTNRNYVQNETMPHALSIRYPVYLPCNLQILSIVHENASSAGTERLVT